MSGDDGLQQRFGSSPAQDDLEAQHWRGQIVEKLFGREATPVSIGRFHILSRVGSGGAGVVYSAWDPKLERRVAVKVLRSEHDPREVEREAKLLAKLNHPNVVSVYDVGECGDGSFLAMEFVDGGTFRDFLGAERSDWRGALTLLEQAAAGLKAAHDVGVVHGDVKPSNLLLGGDGRLRVTDFGTAHAGEADLLGATPAYMAPEQAHGKPATSASDQFSLCVTAFEAFFGVRPFVGTSADEVRDALAAGVRAPVPETSVPRWLRESLERGLSLDPQRRYADLGALLEVWRRGTGMRRGWLLAAGVATVGIAAGIVSSPSGQPARDRCAQTRDRIGAAWNDSRRTALGESFLAHGQPYAARAWTRVQAEIDGHVEELGAVLTEACALSDQEASLRRRLCVERRMIELDALLDVLETDEPAVVEESVQALTLLTDPRGCALEARPLDPPDEDARRAVLESVARARALRGVGKVDEALEILQGARSQAHGLRDPSVTARILLELGDTLAVLEGVSESTPTLATLEAALLAADAADAPHLAARVLLSLAHANHRAARPDDALRWLDRLDDQLEGLDAPRLRGRAAVLRALLQTIGQWGQGEGATREALQALRDTGVRDTWLAFGINNLGELVFERADDATAKLHYLEALEIWTEVVGPSHPYTAGAHGNLGEVELLSGNYDAALEHFTTAMNIRAAAWGKDSYWVAHTRAHVADAQRLAGRLEEAHELYSNVLAFTRREVPLGDAETFFEVDTGSDQLAPWVLHGLALVALQRGDPEAALEWAQQVDPSVMIRPERHPDVAARFDTLALAHLALGQLDEARAVLDRFEPIWRRAYAGGLYKGAYGPLARAELEFAAGQPKAACDAGRRARAAIDSDRGAPSAARARLATIETKCAASQVD